jgi:hypothetical protein
LRELESKGFEIISSAVPIKVRKDEIEFTVGMRRAFMEGGEIVLENEMETGVDMVALVFETVRLATPEQISAMPNVRVVGSQTGQLPEDTIVSRPASLSSSLG